MKNLYLLIAVMLSWLGNAQCVTNGDFESGITSNYSFTMWDAQFTIEDCQVNTSDTGFEPLAFSSTPNDFTVEGGCPTESPVLGSDVFDEILLISNPSVQMPVVDTISGTKAIKLNKSSGGAQITTMSTEIIPTTSIISFNYSFVASYHSSGAEDLQPFFTARLYDINNNTVNLNEFCLKADITNDDVFLQTARPGIAILYTGWQCANLEIPEYLVGQPLRLEFIVADCGETAHYGTAYIDNIRCSAECLTSNLGFITLEEQNLSCPSETFQVCGSFLEPINSTLDTGTLILSIIDENDVATVVPSTATITGNSFCFDVDVADFGVNPSGEYSVKVDASFDSTTSTHVFELFDFTTINFEPINIVESSYVLGHILYWEDVADSYTLEFISDGGCCPDSPAGYDGIYYTVTTTDNFFDIYDAVGGTASKCFRWRIMTDCGWSCWCCLAEDSIVTTIEFPGADYGNVHAPACYEGPLCEETLTIPNAANTVPANVTRFEHLDESIIAYNIVQNDGTGIYKAGEFIELRPDFSAQTGCVFSATIEPCDAIACEISEPLPRRNMATGSEKNEMEESTLYTNSFTVYPNPTNGLITVTGDAASVFTVTDITGKQLMRIANEGQSTSVDIDLSGLNAGIYFLSADGKTIQKIIKN